MNMSMNMSSRPRSIRVDCDGSVFIGGERIHESIESINITSDGTNPVVARITYVVVCNDLSVGAEPTPDMGEYHHDPDIHVYRDNHNRSHAQMSCLGCVPAIYLRAVGESEELAVALLRRRYEHHLEEGHAIR
jgi:hypothetical protein